MKTRIITLALLLSSLLLPAVITAANSNHAGNATSSTHETETLYNAKSASHSISVYEKLILHDRQRNKNLELRLTFPQQGQNLPVIVWSHGAMGSKDIYQRLIRHWASQGYLCIQPNHSDSIDFGKQTDKQKVFGDWQSRPADITLVLDSFDTIEQQIDALKGRIDWSVIGVGGHSFGAHTAQLVAGAGIRKPGMSSYETFSDPRPRAFVLLSPQGTGSRESMFDTGSWQNMKRPVLTVTGSNDPGRTGKGWRWRLEPFLHAPADDKYLLFIEGAFHGFGGIVGSGFATTGPDNEKHVRYVNDTTTAFWDAHLKDDRTALNFLRDGSVAQLTKSEAEIIVRGLNDDHIKMLGKRNDTTMPSTPDAARPIPTQHIMLRFDLDGNGSLSETEMPPRLAPAFSQIDTDGSGDVSAGELSRILQKKRQ